MLRYNYKETKNILFHTCCRSPFESKGFVKYKLAEDTMRNVKEPGWE